MLPCPPLSISLISPPLTGSNLSSQNDLMYYFVSSFSSFHLLALFYYYLCICCLPRWFSGKESACQAGDWVQSLSPWSPGEGNGDPLQHSCLGNPMDSGAHWATVHGVAKSQTRLSDWTTMYLLIYPSTLDIWVAFIGFIPQ